MKIHQYDTYTVVDLAVVTFELTDFHVYRVFKFNPDFIHLHWLLNAHPWLKNFYPYTAFWFYFDGDYDPIPF